MMGGMARSPDEAEPKAAAPDAGAEAREHYAPLDIGALRESVPPADVRAAAPATLDVRSEQWPHAHLANDARKAVIDLHQAGRPVELQQTLVIARGAWSAPRAFLERRSPASPTDTGWYFAPTELGGITAMNTVPVRDLLEVRPDLREVLTLPDGYLVVLDAQGVRSIFTPTGDDAWAAKPAE
jgi:hypothetical protein